MHLPNSTIFCRVESGRGRPLTKTPPNWLTPLWPEIFRERKEIIISIRLLYHPVCALKSECVIIFISIMKTYENMGYTDQFELPVYSHYPIFS